MIPETVEEALEQLEEIAVLEDKRAARMRAREIRASPRRLIAIIRAALQENTPNKGEETNETVDRVRELVDLCEFENYTFHVYPDRDGVKIQATYPEECIQTGAIETQYTRKWLISPHATKSEIVNTLFKCCATSTEHRLREHFLYRGRRVYGPHYDVDELWAISRRIDVRDGHPAD
jgi:hypothetical protein